MDAMISATVQRQVERITCVGNMFVTRTAVGQVDTSDLAISHDDAPCGLR